MMSKEGFNIDFRNDSVADAENIATISLTAFCWWRGDISREASETYWRDVHGIMFARNPGLWQARQLRLAANRSDLFKIDNVSFEVPLSDQPQGIPHGLFRSKADLQMFSNNPLAGKLIPDDTKNFVQRIGTLLSPPHRHGFTLVDRINSFSTQGKPQAATFAICFVPQTGSVSVEDFHDYLADTLARNWSEHPGVLRLRVEPLPPYDEFALKSPGLPKKWPSTESYLGWMELAVRDESVIHTLCADIPDEDLVKHIKAMHPYPVREIYTMISEGRPTEVGLRGYPATEVIASVGSDTQHSDKLLELIFGDIVRGLDAVVEPDDGELRPPSESNPPSTAQVTAAQRPRKFAGSGLKWQAFGTKAISIAPALLKEDGGPMSAYFSRFRKGETADLPAPYSEIWVVISGSLRLRLAESTLTANAGEFLYVPAETLGEVLAVTDAEMICISVPAH